MTTEKQDPKPLRKAPVKQLDPESDLPPDADWEERFNDFWKKNAGGIFGGIALGALVVLGVQVYKYLDVKNEEALRAAFVAASSVSEQVEFADANGDHQLAGLALLKVADAHFADGEFGPAADFYSRAAGILDDGAFSTRARLGQGMSLLASEQTEAAHAVLEGVALDRGSLDQIRGEAAYHLAVSRWQAGNHEGALEALGVVDQLANAGFWAQRAQELQKRIQAGAS